jgi:hypothetical protein
MSAEPAAAGEDVPTAEASVAGKGVSGAARDPRIDEAEPELALYRRASDSPTSLSDQPDLERTESMRDDELVARALSDESFVEKLSPSETIRARGALSRLSWELDDAVGKRAHERPDHAGLGDPR